MSGLLISVDGLDGTGKSTQSRMLCEWLHEQGYQTISPRDPGGTLLGESLREILLHRQEIPLSMTAEMLLYMASRAQLVAEVLRPALDSGKIVVADRYLLANVVYQGSAGGLDTETIWQVGRVATQGLLPDLTVVLDIDVEAAMQRIGQTRDRMESRGIDYMQKVREGFLAQSKVLGSAAMVVDAQQTIDAVHQQITTAVKAILVRG
ncbi:MAG: dTMP kinase [Pirellulaceae bacterium]